MTDTLMQRGGKLEKQAEELTGIDPNCFSYAEHLDLAQGFIKLYTDAVNFNQDLANAQGTKIQGEGSLAIYRHLAELHLRAAEVAALREG